MAVNQQRSAGTKTAKTKPASKSARKTDDLAVAREEQELCDHVLGHLKGAVLSTPPPDRVDDDRALISLRDQIGSSRLEDVPALMAQMEQVAAIASRRGKGSSEPIDPKSPYFGHLRLDEVERGVRDVLIGRGTYVDTKRGVRIVDWRHAPISQLYYRYEEGASYEETFGDREVEGTILARRTVTIIDGDLQRVTSPQGSFVRTRDETSGERGWRKLADRRIALEGGEGSAVRAEHMRRSHLRGRLGSGNASQREDRHLPEIAALLDPRQFELISQPDSGVVIIQGGAGSGKTTIGVHRMAFLAYQSSVRFAPHRMLVVVGTPALREYISLLLDALDLKGVRVVTFGGWAQSMRQRCYPWLNVPIEEHTPAEVARLKTHPGVHRLLEKRATKMRAEGKTGVRDALWLWAEVLTSRKALEQAVGPHADRRQGLTTLQFERAWRYCADRCPAVADYNPEDREPTPTDPILGADGVEEQDDERALLDPEDDALLLRAYQLLRGPLPSRKRRGALTYEHLFVDEAQDLAPIDLGVLAGVVSEAKSITLAGDTSQRINIDTGFRDWNEVLDSLNLEGVAIEPLRIAYRSTKQVMDFAQSVLGPLADKDSPDAPRSGAPVEVHQFPNAGAAAAFLGDALRPLFIKEPRATVALLARYPEQAEAYYQALKMAEVPHLRRVTNYDFSFKPGVEVTEVRQVKGLEYDYVVLLDVNASSYPAKAEARYQLHIGATRAAHQLWVMATGAVSPLVPKELLDT